MLKSAKNLYFAHTHLVDKNMTEIIEVDQLTKKFKLKKSQNGFKSLFRPEYKNVTAVDKISFNIKKGERVAFIGPNGAGNPPLSRCCRPSYIRPPERRAL